VTVLTLELHSPTLPPGKKIAIDLQEPGSVEKTKKDPIVIKEGVEYKYVEE
jgi:Rho GDP-dissociation inhibitor